MTMLKIGLHKRVAHDVYRGWDALNISRLKEIGKSPLQYQHRLLNPRTTEPMRLGSAAHTAVLEPHRFLAEYALWDERTDSGTVRPRRGKDWEAFQAAQGGRSIVRADEHATAMAMRDAARSHPVAGRYLRAGDAEVAMVWESEPLVKRLCKGRVDWLTRDGSCPVLVGLKTARDARPIGFGNAAAKLGYHLQWAFYRDGYEALSGHIARVVEIVVESAPPHDVVVYVIPAEVIEAGREEYVRLGALLAECEASGKWGGSADEEQILSLPSWVYQAEDDLSDLGLEVA